MSPDHSMNGRNALVTGGSRGIGFAIAEQFVKAGANVAVVARSPELLAVAVKKLNLAGPGEAVGVTADVSILSGVEHAFTEAVTHLERIDVLVNNAGVSSVGRFEDLTDERLQADLDLKLFAAVRMIRLAVPGMKSQGWGRIINLLSTSAKIQTARSLPNAISRASGMALTKALSLELAPDNILVNAILVGLALTEQHEELASKAGLDRTSYLAGLEAAIPMGRLGQPSELAAVAHFLASEAGSYVTGTAINVDGGLSPAV